MARHSCRQWSCISPGRFRTSRRVLQRAAPAVPESRQRKIQRHQQRSQALAVQYRHPSRGLAIADLWNEGRVIGRGEQHRREAYASRQSGCQLKSLAGHHHARYALQSRRNWRKRRRYSQADADWVQEVRSGSSYLSSNDLRLHFGLGPASSIDRVEVLWPSGFEESFSVQGVDRFVTLVEGRGSPKPATR